MRTVQEEQEKRPVFLTWTSTAHTQNGLHSSRGSDSQINKPIAQRSRLSHADDQARKVMHTGRLLNQRAFIDRFIDAVLNVDSCAFGLLSRYA